jgi:hypothetical protein
MDDVEGWPWLPDKCPPDMYFIEYMQNLPKWPSLTILHQGPGLHHRVGIECCKLGHRVIGVTVSREEVVSRVFRVDTPNYQVFYANLNEVDTSMLPTLDIVTMFHFGEMAGEFGMPEDSHIQRLLDKMPVNGLIMFYNRSAGRGNSEATLKSMTEKGRILYKETFQELEIYTKC